MKRFLLFALLLISCSPSKEEQATQISLLQDSISNKEAMVEGMSNLMIVRKADLESSRDRLNSIKEFKLLRTLEEREQQIRNQVIIVEKLENEILSLSEKIENEKSSIAEMKRKLALLE